MVCVVLRPADATLHTLRLVRTKGACGGRQPATAPEELHSQQERGCGKRMGECLGRMRTNACAGLHALTASPSALCNARELATHSSSTEMAKWCAISCARCEKRPCAGAPSCIWEVDS